MKRRAATVLAFLAVSLLLSGCDDLPESYDDFFNWSDSFFLKIDTSFVNYALTPLITLLAALALCLGLVALLINMYRVDAPWKGVYLTAVMIMFVIALLPVHIEVTTYAGSSIFDRLNLKLDDVIDALHWKLTADIGEAITTVWAFNITINIPHMCATWQVVMVIATAIALFVSIMRKTLQGVVFSITMVFGWLFFLSIYGLTIGTIDRLYDPKPILSTASFYNGGYVFMTVASMVICYVVFPWLCSSATGYVESRYVHTERTGDASLSKSGLLRAYRRSRSFFGRFKSDRDSDGEVNVDSRRSTTDDRYREGGGITNLLPPGPSRGSSSASPGESDIGPKPTGPNKGPGWFPTSGSRKPSVSDSNEVEEGVFYDVGSKNGDVLPMGPKTDSTIRSFSKVKKSAKGSNARVEKSDSINSEENLLPETVAKSKNNGSWLGKVANTTKLVGALTHEPRVIMAGEAAGVADDVMSIRKEAKRAKRKKTEEKETHFNILSALKDDPVEHSLLPETRKRG